MGGTYHGLFRNIRRATKTVARTRRRDGTRRIRESGARFPIVSRRGRRFAGSHWLPQLLSLVLPGLLLGLFSLPRLLSADPYVPEVQIQATAIVWFSILATVFAVRAGAATAPLWVRIVGVAFSFTYPAFVYLAMHGWLR